MWAADTLWNREQYTQNSTHHTKCTYCTVYACIHLLKKKLKKLGLCGKMVKLESLFISHRQCCGSGMFIPEPGSWFLPIPDPGSRISDPGSKNSNKRQGWKFFFVKPFFVGTNLKKLNIFYFWYAVEKNLAQFSKNYWSFYPKNCHQALKNMGLGSGIRDPRSRIRKKPIPDPGSRIQGSKRHRIPDPDPQHWP